MNKSPNPQLKKTCRIGRLICQNKLFRINGFTLLNYTDVGLAGVDFDFVAVVVIELGRCEVAGDVYKRQHLHEMRKGADPAGSGSLPEICQPGQHIVSV